MSSFRLTSFTAARTVRKGWLATVFTAGALIGWTTPAHAQLLDPLLETATEPVNEVVSGIGDVVSPVTDTANDTVEVLTDVIDDTTEIAPSIPPLERTPGTPSPGGPDSSGRRAANEESALPVLPPESAAAPLSDTVPDVRATTELAPALIASVASATDAKPTTIPEFVLETATRFGIPIGLAIVVLGFLVIQGRIDGRDPKLAAAPLASERKTLEFE